MRDFSSDKSFSAYCSSLDAEILTHEEEIMYGNMIQSKSDGYEHAIEKMWEANLRLVIKIYHDEFESRNKDMSKNDIIGHGNLGLYMAVIKFDPNKGNRFCTYAKFWICKEIRKAMATKGNSSGYLHMPASAVSKINRIKAARWDHMGKKGTEPDVATIAEMTNMSEATVISLLPMCDWHRTRVAYIDKGACHEDSIRKQSETKEEICHMRRAMSLLDKREAAVLIMRGGLDGNNPMRLEDVSAVIKRTRERVRQIQDKACMKLQKIMEAGVDEGTEEIDYEEVVKEVCG
jgi:RNA polymerase primary sigma factor